MDSLNKCPKHRKINMRFGTWNVRSLYSSDSLMAVVKEVSEWKLDVVGVQEVR
jgi:exonuclease III